MATLKRSVGVHASACKSSEAAAVGRQQPDGEEREHEVAEEPHADVRETTPQDRRVSLVRYLSRGDVAPITIPYGDASDQRSTHRRRRCRSGFRRVLGWERRRADGGRQCQARFWWSHASRAHDPNAHHVARDPATCGFAGSSARHRRRRRPRRVVVSVLRELEPPDGALQLIVGVTVALARVALRKIDAA